MEVILFCITKKLSSTEILKIVFHVLFKRLTNEKKKESMTLVSLRNTAHLYCILAITYKNTVGYRLLSNHQSYLKNTSVFDMRTFVSPDSKMLKTLLTNIVYPVTL